MEDLRSKIDSAGEIVLEWARNGEEPGPTKVTHFLSWVCSVYVHLLSVFRNKHNYIVVGIGFPTRIFPSSVVPNA